MKCSLLGCSGEYEQRSVTHTVHYQGQLVVIDHVPARVCSACGDVMFDTKTARRIEQLLKSRSAPAHMAPVYEFAGKAA